MSKFEEIKKAYASALPTWWFSYEASESFEWLINRVDELSAENDQLKDDQRQLLSLFSDGDRKCPDVEFAKRMWHLIVAKKNEINGELLKVAEELKSTRKFISESAENYIDLCRQLGAHHPIRDERCFGTAECINCFRVGFAVLEHAKLRNKQILSEQSEDKKLIALYRVHVKKAEAEIEKLKSALNPVLAWYDGDGRIVDYAVIVEGVVADLQRDRKELLQMREELKKLWNEKPKEHVRMAALEEEVKDKNEFIMYVRDSMHLNTSPEIRDAAKKVLEGEDW